MKQFPVFRMFIFTTCLLQAISPLCTTLLWSQTNAEPIIDMHLHAKHAGELGPPPLYICAPFPAWPVRDPLEDPHAWFAGLQRKPACLSFLRSGTSDEDLMRRTLENLKSRNVTVAVTDGDLEVMEKWKQASEGHILPALPFDPESGKPSVDELRQLVKSRRVMAFAEISSQYEGIAVTDSRMEPYFALAEELDIPVGIHMGPGPPGASYVFAPSYRMRMSSLLTLEDVLVRHPKLRVWAMHAGWPLADDAIAALYAHPQLYVDIGSSTTLFPESNSTISCTV